MRLAGKIGSLMSAGLLALVAVAQPPAPRVSGAVKAASAEGFTVTSAAGQDVVVSVASGASILQVAPGSKDLKSASAATLDSIAAGDKVIVTGTAGDAPALLHATRVIVMHGSDIAQNHAAEEAAWRSGGGGLVKSVDASAGTVTVSNGAKMLLVQTTPATKFSRYNGESVRFEDRVASKLTDVQAGDQLRVRGTRSADGTSVSADEIVTGTFHNYSGILTAVDGTAGTVTLKDLASKKVVVVKVSKSSDLRRLPAQAAARFAARAAGSPVGQTGAAPGSSSANASGPGGNARAGMDLSQMLARLPTETMGGLKVGDAVMIVATESPTAGTQSTAVTLLAGVEPILQAAPQGEMVLTPWGVGGGAPEGGQ